VVFGSGGSRSPQPLPELHQGYDTTTQITALADWLRVQPAPSPPPPSSSAERRKLWRDALRLTLWRATGSTGGWLVPEQVARKRAACGM